MAAIVVSYHLFLYDLTLLLLPVGLALNRWIFEDTQPADQDQINPAPKIMPLLHRWLAPAATAILLIAPIERFLIAERAIYLLSIPIVVLTLFDRHLDESDGPSRTTSPEAKLMPRQAV